MSATPLFFDKNRIDESRLNVTITASEGQDFADSLRDRKNTTGWGTGDSLDSNNTNIVFDYTENETLTDIIMVLHNFKSYTVQYWDGAAYQDFVPAINVTGNALETTSHNFASIQTTKLKLVIRGTFVANDAKAMAQFYCTRRLGTLEGWPVIAGVEVSKNRQVTQMLSGKVFVLENVGFFKCTMAVDVYNSDNDLTIFEEIYSTPDGVVLWICGGDESQFSHKRVGYRKQDLFLVKPTDEYKPNWYKGFYKSGIKFQIDLQEAVD